MTVRLLCALFILFAFVQQSLGADASGDVFIGLRTSADKNLQPEILFNGEVVGRGHAGFEKAVARVQKLPPGRSIVWGHTEPKASNPFQTRFPKVWLELEEVARLNGHAISATHEVAPRKTLTAAAAKTQRVTEIAWSNYHGPTTPDDEVLYLINGRYVGRGNAGFDAILNHVRQTEKFTLVSVPHYEYQWPQQTLDKYASFGTPRPDVKKQNQINNVLARVFPFAPRKQELDRLIDVDWSERTSPAIVPANDIPRTVLDWSSGDKFGNAFAEFGRIVRHDEEPTLPSATLGWIEFDARTTARQLESTATYTLNGEPLEKGFAGFTQAMQRLNALPPESIVQIKVCLRTQPPFSDPIVFENCRHFERTGYEPYFGLFPALINLAQKRNLQIEWIPDEAEPLQAAKKKP